MSLISREIFDKYFEEYFCYNLDKLFPDNNLNITWETNITDDLIEKAWDLFNIENPTKEQLDNIDIILNGPGVASRKILDIIREEQQYFEENPKHLKFVIKNWLTIFHSGRVIQDVLPYAISSQCEDNPKYALEDISDDETYEAYVYEAWASDCYFDIDPDDEYYPVILKFTNKKFPTSKLFKLETKANKTLDEWVELKTNPHYRFNALYPSRRRVIDYLMNTIGTGYEWNKDGFIELRNNDCKFTGYTYETNKIRKDIKRKLSDIYNSKWVKFFVDGHRDIVDKSRRKRYEEKLEELYRDIEVFPDMFEKYGTIDLDELTVLKETNIKLFLKEMEKIEKARSKYINKQIKLMLKDEGMDTKKRGRDNTWYPISDYSHIYTIPDNAHISYVVAAKEIIDDIRSNESNFGKRPAQDKEFIEKVYKNLNKKFKL